MMKRRKVILCAFVAMVGFIVGSIYFYEYKKMEIEQMVKDTFVEVVKAELEKRIAPDERDSYFSSGSLLEEDEVPPKPITIWYPDGEKRRHQIDPKKHWKNIAMDSKERMFHTCAFEEKALIPDTLNIVLQECLKQENLECQTGIRMYVTDRDEKVTTTLTSDSKWCKTLFWLCTAGYRCELTFVVYLEYSVWQLIGMKGIFFALVYLLGVWSIYKVLVVVKKKMNPGKIMIEKEIVREIVKEVPIQVIASAEIKLYQLTEYVIYNARERKLTVKSQSVTLPPQTAILLELFLKAENNTLLSETIEKNLWIDGSGNDDRVRQAITRLRKALEIVPLSSIQRLSMGNYRFSINN